MDYNPKIDDLAMLAISDCGFFIAEAGYQVRSGQPLNAIAIEHAENARDALEKLLKEISDADV